MLRDTYLYASEEKPKDAGTQFGPSDVATGFVRLDLESIAQNALAKPAR